MKQKILPQIFLYTLLLFPLFSFNQCNNPSENAIIYSYQIFYLEDNKLTYSDIENLPIDKLVLQQNPIISEKDIGTFTVLYLTNNPVQSYHLSYNHSIMEKFGEEVRPFVLVLNGEKYCIGECWPNFMSIVPKSILLYRIREDESWLQPNNDKGNTILKDQRIISTLEKVGVKIIYKDIGGN